MTAAASSRMTPGRCQLRLEPRERLLDRLHPLAERDQVAVRRDVERRVVALELVGDHPLHRERRLDPGVHRARERVRAEHVLEEAVPLALGVGDELAPRVEGVVGGSVSSAQASRAPCPPASTRALHAALSRARGASLPRSSSSAIGVRRVRDRLLEHRLVLAQHVDPAREEEVAGLRQRVHPPRRPGLRRVPERRHQPVFSSWRSVRYTVPESNAGSPASRELLRELVAVRVPVPQERQQRRRQQVAVQPERRVPPAAPRFVVLVAMRITSLGRWPYCYVTAR